VTARGPDGRFIIELCGPDGNAFAMIALARKTARALGEDPDPIVKEMQAGDYVHLLDVFMRHFGEIFDLRMRSVQDDLA